MRKIEEKNMEIGLCLKKISFIYLLILLLSCSTSKNVQNNEPQLTGYLRNFVLVDNQNFKVSVPFKIDNIESIELSHPNDFKIVSTTTINSGTIIEILKITDKLFQGLTLYFLDDGNDLKKTQVYFYSKLINVNDISKDDEIVFDRTRDIVPPLFFIRTSIQSGLYKVCIKDTIINDFSMLHDLYFLSFRTETGHFYISEIDCKNILFRYVVQP